MSTDYRDREMKSPVCPQTLETDEVTCVSTDFKDSRDRDCKDSRDRDCKDSIDR